MTNVESRGSWKSAACDLAERGSDADSIRGLFLPLHLRTGTSCDLPRPDVEFICLGAEIPNSGDYKTTRIGDAPVIVTRAADGTIHAFENQCAHRGALVCLNPCGNIRNFTCIYHSWSYDLKGNLTGVPGRERRRTGHVELPSDLR